MSAKLSHIDAAGQARMVDVTDKPPTRREARAEVRIRMLPETRLQIERNQLKKGDVLAVARIAGIQAAKKCAELIPLCHPLALSNVAIEFSWLDNQPTLRIETSCKLSGPTGVEMEALTAASIAALTVFDMAKAIDKNMVIDGLKVLEKSGGKSGHWRHS